MVLSVSSKQYRLAQQFGQVCVATCFILIAQLLLTDAVLLKTILEAKSAHGDAKLGEALQRVFRAYGKDYDLIKIAVPKAVEGLSA